MPKSPTALMNDIAAFRRFNRMYTSFLGTLNEGLLNSDFSLAEGAGFRLVAEEPHHSFGKDLVGQTWELELG
jgi:hypothetical protein